MNNTMTHQEYCQVARILDRYKVSDIIEQGDTLTELAGASFRHYFQYLPQAVALIATKDSSNLNKFIEELGRINALLVQISEQSELIYRVADLLNTMHNIAIEDVKAEPIG